VLKIECAVKREDCNNSEREDRKTVVRSIVVALILSAETGSWYERF